MPLVCCCALTLVCCPLLALFVSPTQLLLAVALQRAKGNLAACFLPHFWQQLRVVYGVMRAVGGEEGGAHVSADLRFAQHAWSARTRLLLQRGRRAVPALMPTRDCAAAPGHCVASGKCAEGASGIVWSVLEQDVMLGLGAEMRHGCRVHELRMCGEADWTVRLDGARFRH
jgi:hypothetical protein